MKREQIELSLPPENGMEEPRECRMSIDLYENARLTMGELRDFMRATGISWEFIQQQIDRANRRPTGVERALDSMDPYTTGPGRSLRDLPSNVW